LPPETQIEGFESEKVPTVMHLDNGAKGNASSDASRISKRSKEGKRAKRRGQVVMDSGAEKVVIQRRRQKEAQMDLHFGTRGCTHNKVYWGGFLIRGNGRW